MRNYDEFSSEELNQMMIDEVERTEHQEWLNRYSLKNFETTSYGADKYLIEHESKEFLYEITVLEKEITGTKYLNIRDTDGTVLDNDILDMSVEEVESILTVIEDKELGRNNFSEKKKEFEKTIPFKKQEEAQKMDDIMKWHDKVLEEEKARQEKVVETFEKHGVEYKDQHTEENFDLYEVVNKENENTEFKVIVNHDTQEIEAQEISTTTGKTKEMDYSDVKRTLNAFKETERAYRDFDTVFNKYKHSHNEGIADSLNFLTDKNGKNHYEQLKDNSFECKNITEVNKGKHFTDYSIELEDKNRNNFQYRIRTEKTKSEIKKEWTKDLTGEDWLNQDIKTDVLKARPHYELNNQITGKPENAQPFKDFVQEQSAPKLKL